MSSHETAVSPTPNTETRIRAGISRFRQWRRHSDETIAQQVLQVQNNQTERLRSTHADLLDDPRFNPITEFFLSEIYTGLDLNELAREIEKALPVASRMLPDSVMRTAAIAVECNALTGELDEAVAEWLLAHQITTPTDDDIVRAYQASDLTLRHEQARLLRELGLGLDRYVRSRLITATFKMSAGPARMAGLGGLYDFMAKGFSVMKPMKSVADFLDVFLGRELKILDNLAIGHPQPFTHEILS